MIEVLAASEDLGPELEFLMLPDWELAECGALRICQRDGEGFSWGGKNWFICVTYPSQR